MMRNLLKKSVQRKIDQSGYDSNNVALALSAGTDSLCILLACLDLDIRPVCYTYCLEDVHSADWELAKEVCQYFDLRFNTVKISSKLTDLIADVKRLVYKYDITKKVNVQCCHGHLYLARVIEEDCILNGSGVDGLYGTYSSMLKAGVTKSLSKFNELRKDHLVNSNDDAMQDQVLIYAIEGGTEVLFPYRNEAITTYLLNHSWEEINTPDFKSITIDEFPEIKENGWYRRRGSQQIIAGIRKLHERLLGTHLNRNNSTRVREVYKGLKEN